MSPGSAPPSMDDDWFNDAAQAGASRVEVSTPPFAVEVAPGFGGRSQDSGTGWTPEDDFAAESAMKDAGPPWTWLGLAAGLPVVLGVSSLLLASTWMHAVAWAVICAAGFGLLMVFTARDLRARESNSYVAYPGTVAILRIVVIVATLAFSLLNAWLFADWFARLPMFLGRV